MTNESKSVNTNETEESEIMQYLKPDKQQAELVQKQQTSTSTAAADSKGIISDTSKSNHHHGGNIADKLNIFGESFMAGHNERMKSFKAGHDKRMQMFHSVIEQVGGQTMFKQNDQQSTETRFIKADMMCLVWKRRDGLAKLSNSWEKRLIALVGDELLYYNVEDDFVVDCNKCPQFEAVRGKFDLAKTPLHVYVTSDKMSPTPYCLSIKLSKCDPGMNRGWKVCFENVENQIKWLVAISKVVVQNDPKGLKRSTGDINDVNDKQPYQHISDEESHIADERTPLITKTLKYNDPGVSEVVTNRFCLTGKSLLLTIAAFNVALIAGSTWFIILIDLILFKLIQTIPLQSTSQVKGAFENEQDQKKITIKQPINDGFTPGFSTIKSGVGGDENSLLPKWKLATENLLVRSDTYLVDKQKYLSSSPLYELVQCDIFISPEPDQNFSRRVDLSKLGAEKSNGLDDIPDILIISMSLPIDAPKISFGSSSDTSRSFTLVFYFRLSDDTLKLLNDEYIEHPARNALKLWQKWCSCSREPTSESNKKILSRFKLIPLVLNPDECGLPASMSGYNNKPMLVKRIGTTGLINQRSIKINDSINLNCLEFNINFHEFPFIAKQAFSYLLQNVMVNCEAILGFVIEARDDDELPEVVCGMGQICRPNLTTVQEIE